MDDHDEESVQKFLDGVSHSKRRRDAGTLLEIMARVTGERARMWGTIIGFGEYHYKYQSGREGDAPAAGFSPRKAATTVYLPDGVGAHADLLGAVGPTHDGSGLPLHQGSRGGRSPGTRIDPGSVVRGDNSRDLHVAGPGGWPLMIDRECPAHSRPDGCLGQALCASHPELTRSEIA